VKKQIQQKQYSRQNKLPNKKPPHYDAKQERNAEAAVLSELKRIESGGNVTDELLDTIEQINTTLYGMKGDGGVGV